MKQGGWPAYFSSAYFGLVAAFLLIAALAKLYSASGDARILSARDPLLPASNREVFVAAGLVELAVAVYLTRCRDIKLKHLTVLWLSCNFIVYRLAISFIGYNKPCPCLGTVSERLPLSPHVIDRLLWAMVAIMFMGSSFCLMHPSVVAFKSRLGERGRNRLERAFQVGFVLALLPGVQAGCVAATKPFTTGPILLRSTKSILAGPAQPAAQFIWTDLNRVPPGFLKAVLAAEDRHFFEHGGFDWQEIRRSILTSVERGDRLRGASTISQQCARSLFLWQGRSWIRKGLEAYYTLWMELLLSKRRILELYVNVIELGDGIYGVEAAARHYYNKSARDLTREEAAMLAAILPAPKRWNPLQPTEQVKRWQETILARMDKVQLPWEEVSESNQIRAAAPAADARVEKPEQKSDAAAASSGSPESVR